jgi:hypothetical protein
VSFHELSFGDIFEYGKDFYMVSNCGENGNAVCLADGLAEFFDINTRVNAVKATLTIEG